VISISIAEAARPRAVAPPGWSIGAVEVVAPGGRGRVVVTRLPVDRGDSIESLAEREGARLASELPGYRQESLERRETPDGEVVVRTYSSDGEPKRAIQLLAASGASASLDGVATDGLLDAAVEAVAAFSFGAPRGLSGAYAVEELTALAELAGAASFPGTGGHAFESERERGAAVRGLLARGTLRPAAGGRPVLEPLDERTIQAALRPQAVVEVERGSERCLIYVREGLAVAHSAGAQGVHVLEPVPAVLLGATLRTLAGLRSGARETSAQGRARIIGEENEGREVAWGAGEPAAALGDRLQALAAAVNGSTV
jgi:hypothetical protein